jgi:hypothetical protein
VRKIAFGRLGVLPHDFYSMSIDDAALMYQGWGDQLLYEQQLWRKVTMIISDVVNKSAGGKGVMKNGSKIWPLPGDTQKIKASHMDLLKKFKDLDLKNGVKKNGKR